MNIRGKGGGGKMFNIEDSALFLYLSVSTLVILTTFTALYKRSSFPQRDDAPI